MSALGLKRTLRLMRPMSALPPKADIGTQPRNVRFVCRERVQQKSAIEGQLVRSPRRRSQAGWAARQPQRLGNDQSKSCWLLD
jgi:hypothetical protein